MILFVIGVFILGYVLLTLYFTYLVQQIPRKPVDDQPDWGKIADVRIATVEGGSLEVWRIEPDQPSRGIVVLAHGWGRNRDRMVSRARYFGQWGFTTVIHSARDHGKSSPRRFMNAMRFAEDIEAVVKWVAEPVILYGHSAGAGGAILAASNSADKIKLLLLESCYADTEKAMLNLYRWFNPFFGNVFGPAIIFWMNLFYRHQLDNISPARLASSVSVPVMIIHGENDRRFPLAYARKLHNSFAPGQSELYVAPGVGHSDSSKTAGYPAAVKAFVDRHWPHDANRAD
jgi:pimeloyl-ACP methyl ester carboxylesterase